MDGRGDGVRGEESVGEFEEGGVGSWVEAFVERAAEGAKSVVGFHDAFIMHSSKDRRILFLPMELKRKLSSCSIILGGKGNKEGVRIAVNGEGRANDPDNHERYPGRGWHD